MPDVSATALAHEVHRRAIDARAQSGDDPNIAILHATIPAEEGGWWIRELGVYAEPLDEGGEPVLYAYGNHAPYYKMLPQAGQMNTPAFASCRLAPQLVQKLPSALHEAPHLGQIMTC